MRTIICDTNGQPVNTDYLPAHQMVAVRSTGVTRHPLTSEPIMVIVVDQSGFAEQVPSLVMAGLLSEMS